MTIERNRNNHNFHSNSGNNGNFGEHTERIRAFHHSHAGALKVEVPSSSTSEEHNESMKVFRGSHGDIVLANAPRYGEAARLERTQPLKVSYSVMETGGARSPSGITDWSALMPTWKVAPHRFSQN